MLDDILYSPLNDCISLGYTRDRGIMENQERLASRDDLLGVIGVHPLDLPLSSKLHDCHLRIHTALAISREHANHSRMYVTNHKCISGVRGEVLFTPSFEVVTSHKLTPLGHVVALSNAPR